MEVFIQVSTSSEDLKVKENSSLQMEITMKDYLEMDLSMVKGEFIMSQEISLKVNF